MTQVRHPARHVEFHLLGQCSSVPAHGSLMFEVEVDHKLGGMAVRQVQKCLVAVVHLVVVVGHMVGQTQEQVQLCSPSPDGDHQVLL